MAQQKFFYHMKNLERKNNNKKAGDPPPLHVGEDVLGGFVWRCVSHRKLPELRVEILSQPRISLQIEASHTAPTSGASKHYIKCTQAWKEGLGRYFEDI